MNLLPAATSHPHLLAPARQRFERPYGELGVGLEAGLVRSITAALHGISLREVLNPHQFSKWPREAMRRALQRLDLNLV